MSRYTLLFLLNLPLILLAILSAVTQYKLHRMSRRSFLVQILLWIGVMAGLLFAEPFYTWLFSNDLTDTESLSLFDVVQITAIVITFYILNRVRIKAERTERRLNDLHQELSIKLSK